MIFEPKSNEPIVPPEDESPDDEPWPRDEEPPDDGSHELVIDYPETEGGSDVIQSPTPGFGPKKYYVDGVPVEIINERVQYMDGDGRLITESLQSYCKKAILKKYASLDDFLTKWSKARQKQAIIEELIDRGVFLEELREEVGKDFDAFDLVCHIAFDREPLTRRERLATR